MDSKKVSTTLFIVGGIALIAGAGAYFYQQYKMMDYLCYGLKKFKFKKIGLDSTTIELLMTIENKGNLDVDLKRLTMDVYANGDHTATINQDVLTPIKPLQSTELPIQVSFNPKNALGSIVNILSSTTSLDSIAFRFKGKAVVKKWGIPIPVPFDFTYTIAELRAPSGASVCEDKK
jgi:hypothetical protein